MPVEDAPGGGGRKTDVVSQKCWGVSEQGLSSSMTRLSQISYPYKLLRLHTYANMLPNIDSIYSSIHAYLIN